MVNEMSNRIVPLLVAVSIVITLPGSACRAAPADDDWDFELEVPIVIVGVTYSFFSLMLTMYNNSRLEADDPSKGGGAAGFVVGSFTALFGVAAVIYPHPAARVTGAACMAAGGYTVYTGVKSLGAVRRKFIEEEERGLTLSPILIEDGTGKLSPGMQVSWSF